MPFGGTVTWPLGGCTVNAAGVPCVNAQDEMMAPWLELFVQRASAVRPGFAVTEENAPAIAEICARLDGLPMAIELAAARIKVLTPQAMAPKLRQGLDMLASTARDLPERQRTLRGAIQWSWDLLEPLQRRLFARLAVFVAGATLPDIERVCSPDGELGGDVLDLLS